MATYKLTYFDFAGSRGEECRLALHLAGLPFEDVRVDRAMWIELKPKTPYGSMPILEVDGKTLAQSNAILRFIGSQHGLHPNDPFEAARHEGVMEAVEELRGKLDPSLRAKDEIEKKRLREELATGYLPAWGTSIDKQIRGPFVGGANLSIADLKVFSIARWFASGSLDHVPATIFAHCPRIVAHREAFPKHPAIERWYAAKR